MEVNIVRYISRLFPKSSPLNYESQGSLAKITEKDAFLDRIQDAINSKGKNKKDEFLNELNQR